MTYYGEDRQDYFLEEVAFKGFKHGFFVDVGANWPEQNNNTIYFEKTHNWTGVNIEPIPRLFQQLQTLRPNCININCAIHSTKSESDFILNEGYTESQSGLVEYYDPRQLEKMQQENKQYNCKSSIVKVATDTLENIFSENNIQQIQFLNVDVEGAELEVMKSINFQKVFIDVIGFEHNYEDISNSIVEYLQQKGYHIFLRCKDIFMIHQKSQFVYNVKEYMNKLAEEKLKQENEQNNEQKEEN
jgi:FkbM family methyltransferase